MNVFFPVALSAAMTLFPCGSLTASAGRPKTVPAQDGVSRNAGPVLVSGGLRVSFGGVGEGFGIRALENRIDGTVAFGNAARDRADFWELMFTTDGGADSRKAVRLDNRAPCRERRFEKKPDRLVFHWRGLTVPGGDAGAVDVCAEVKKADGSETEWRISVKNADARFALFNTRYPCIPGVVPDGVADVLTPGRNLGGRLVKKFDSRKERRRSWGYPGLYPMVSAFMRDGAGLYVAAHDSDARIKTLSLAQGNDLSFVTVVENAGVSGKAAEGPRYPVVISAFRGDWWQAARRYRTWARKQRWCAKGPIAMRDDWPHAMSDVDLWMVSNQCSPENLRKRMGRISEMYPDLKLGVHWYGWNREKPGLGECPYFTPGPEVPETVAFMKERGILLMPYVDGRLQSRKSARFASVTNEACRRASGRFNEEKWGAASYVVMCPTGRRFGKAVLDTATNTVFGCGFDAVYEDQVACSRALPCFDGSHGHPVGGGRWWTDGYRRILEPMHASLAAANRPITSEGSGEMWLDLIDGYLQAESPQGTDVPFFPAVYGGYAVYFGARINYMDPRAFFALQARALSWGVAPNWQRVSEAFVEGRLPGAVEILRRVARVRKAAGEFLKYGMLEDALRPLDDTGVMRVEWLGADGEQWGKPFSAELPVVSGTVWKNVSGSRTAVCAVNIADEPRTIRFASMFGCEPRILDVEGERPAKLSADGPVLVLDLPPQGLAVLTGPSASFSVAETTPASHMNSRTNDKKRDPGLFGDYWWANRFLSRSRLIGKVKGDTVDVVLLGDSIMHFWEWKHPKSWKKFTCGRKVLNLGYGGDRTQQVLWRIAHGELDGYRAKYVVLMIGTNNNTSRNSKPENVAAGIEKIVAEIRERQPEAKIILHPVFPRGNSPDSKHHAGAHARNVKTNALLKRFAESDGGIIWIDFNDKLIDASGWVPRSVMPDEIHPSSAGYDIWMEALAPVLSP